MREEAISTIPEATQAKFAQLAELLKQASVLARDISHSSEQFRHAISKDQLWFWTNKWQTIERQVDNELVNGDYADFNSVQELIADLNEQV